MDKLEGTHKDDHASAIKSLGGALLQEPDIKKPITPAQIEARNSNDIKPCRFCGNSILGFTQETTQWIHTHVDHKLSKRQFFTRPNDVSCPPAELKAGLVERFMASDPNILFTVDDDPDVCTAYNALGIPTFTPPTKCSSLAS